MNNKPVAWITGGATGIGFAAAQTLAAAGYAVVISGRREVELNRASTQLSASGADATAIALDVSQGQAVATAFDAILKKHGRIDALVCSAGTNVPNRFWANLTPDAFAKVVSINLNGVAYCLHAVLPTMRQAGRGTVVVVSSWAGWRYAGFTGVPYSATKMGLAPLVESLNDQEGKNGIRATLVCPGEVATPILKTRPTPPSEAEIAKMLRPEDVANAVAYAVQAPQHVCINELVISPTWNRMYIGGEDLTPK
jgi:NADP-dependent 3-hydroxy acid dehydrogenase YdfG